MTVTGTACRLTVVRNDRGGERPPAYLRGFVLAGRAGVKQLSFGQRVDAHVFESRAEAEDVARRLRRRISGGDYVFGVEEVSQAPAVSP